MDLPDSAGAAPSLPVVLEGLPLPPAQTPAKYPMLFYLPAVSFVAVFLALYLHLGFSFLVGYAIAAAAAYATESARDVLATWSGDDGDETIIATALYTVPLVLGFKAYQLLSGPVFFMLRTRGVDISLVPEIIPMKRRKETAAVLLFMALLPLTVVDAFFCLSLLYSPYTAVPLLTYMAWILLVDRSPRDGSRKAFLRSNPVAKHFCDYFPIKMVATTPLAPDRKYVFAYHPHGIIGMGAFGAFATDYAGFPELFPGIERRLCTLDQNFRWPFLRELLLFTGVCSVARESCDAILSRGPGSAICIVVGGAAEALETSKGTYRLVLQRKGFVRVAAENDACLVPVLGFGETSLFETLTTEQESPLRKWQKYFQGKLGFSVPIFWGRGVLNYDFGFMPRRVPITVVCGKPIDPVVYLGQGLEGEDLVAAMHKEYIEALTRLFHEHKDTTEAGRTRVESIRIVS